MVQKRLPDPYQNIPEGETKKYLQDLVRDTEIALTELGQFGNPLIGASKISFENVTESTTVGKYEVVLVNASASAVTVTLPDPLEAQRKLYWIKKINTNANDVTVTVVTSATIDEQSNFTLTGADKPCITVFSDGSGYWIINI